MTAEPAETVAVEVDCPDCLNLNRESRRACRRARGMCGGTGVVVKHVPVAPEPCTHAGPCGPCGRPVDRGA